MGILVYRLLTTIICQLWMFSFVWCHHDTRHHDYCIVGAGPAGLQMGYFFKRAGRDYVIFERSNFSGSFFSLYPRHRTLISLNKRHTGKPNKEFNLRHDWNSLLSDDETLKFTRYSKELFPDADTYLEYLKDYKDKLGLHVQFNTEISNIKQILATNNKDRMYGFIMKDQRGTNYSCGRLIIATGVAKPVIPAIPGIQYTEGYETMSLNKSDYEGQTVLILGRGNSAFETATHIYGSTNFVSMIGRSRVRLSWATHYVGDLRAVNNQLLDTYQLKSLDGIIEIPANDITIVKIDGKLHARVNPKFTGTGKPIRTFNFRVPYDKIIRCLGFTFDADIFHSDMKMTNLTGRKRKFIAIYPNYESVDYPGMFVAGTASHSLDFRESAGGFIHGYRYTARALFHLLEWKYHKIPWPSVTVSIGQLVNHIMIRINEGSGFYQMFSVLGDIVILNDDDTFTYLEEVPIQLLDKLPTMTGHNASSIIVVNMQYGPDWSGPGNDVFRPDRATGEFSKSHKSNFLHPVLYFYDKLPSEKDMRLIGRKEHLPRPKRLHHIVEDFYTVFDSPLDVLHLRRLVENIRNEDMRDRFSDSCLKVALTNKRLPYHCRETYMKGEGLSQ